MSKARAHVSIDLEVLSPLHVGSGLDRTVDAVKGADGRNTNNAPRVAAIQRDVSNLPYLPGSTIKGLLHRLAAGAMEQKIWEQLLGSIAAKETGKRGSLSVSGASMLTPGLAKHLPYADRAGATGPGAIGEGVFVAAGTAIDRASGVANSSSLRHAEAVAPGAVFRLGFTVEVRGADAAKRCDIQVGLLLQLLMLLDRGDGQAIGAGQADGDGRVKIRRSTLVVTKSVLASDGNFDAAPVAVIWPDAVGERDAATWKLVLTCDGPFAVLDPSWAERRKDGDPMLAAQRSAEKKPVLPGSSVSGALRARAAWLVALAARRRGEEPERDGLTQVYKPGTSLTPVQRLFGVTGFRALLDITELAINEPATPWKIFSVKLDRFSGGPIDGALFETEAYLGVVAQLQLTLHDRGGRAGKPTAEDQSLAECLIADICDNGLTLGHGGNKGFGWFRVETEGADASRSA